METLARLIRSGDLLIDTYTHRVERDGQEIRLPKLTYRLLVTLVDQAPRVLDATTLIDLVWQGVAVSEETLKQRVKRLRKALGDPSESPRYVATVRGEGYRWIPDVQPLEEEVSTATSVTDEQSPESSVETKPVPNKRKRSLWHTYGAAAALFLVGFFALRPLLNEQAEPTVVPPMAPRGIVLTLAPMGIEPLASQNDYFSEGLLSQLGHVLGHVPNLQVYMADGREFAFDNDRPNMADDRVRFRLEAEAKTRDDLLTGRFQLVDQATGQLIWESEIADPLATWPQLQRNISLQVATALDLPIPQDLLREPRFKSMADKRALDAYLRGMDAYHHYSHRKNEEAIDLFHKALKIDPNYAPAYAGLAMAYCQQAIRFGEPMTVLEQAMDMARQALTLAPESAEAHKALGQVNLCLGFQDRALVQFEHAVNLDPTYTDAMLNIASLMHRKGRVDEAAPWLKRARLQNGPLLVSDQLLAEFCSQLGLSDSARTYFRKALETDGDNVITRLRYARFFLTEGEFPAARQQAEILIEQHPTYRWAYLAIADAYLFEGRLDEAEHFYRQALALDEHKNDFSYAEMRLQLLAWKRGERDPARLAMLLEYGQQDLENDRYTPHMAFFMTLIYSVTDREEEALYWLQKAIDQGWTDYRTAKKEPMLQNLHKDHTFRQMMDSVERKMHLQRKRILENLPELESAATL